MSTPAALSLALGGLLGAANAVAAWALWRLARARPTAQFTVVVLGGMLARMAAVLVAFAVCIALLPVHPPALVAGLFGTFVVGLAAEVALIHRNPSPPSPDPG